MLRLYDWQCSECDSVTEHLLDSRTGRSTVLWCQSCEMDRAHSRLFPLVARYLGDRPHSPMVYGSDLDTAGWRLPSMDMPQPAEAHSLVGPDGYVDIPHEAMREHFETREWKAWESEKIAFDKENVVKRRRRSKIKAGENIDVKHYKLPGDPRL